VKILFGALHFGYYRNFESVIVSLAERGHSIHLSADEPEGLGGQALVDRLTARYPGITASMTPSLDEVAWFRLARRVRIGRDYVRFHEPHFERFAKARIHLADRVPRAVYRVMHSKWGGRPACRAVATGALAGIERLLPISSELLAYVRQHDPDLVLLASVTAWRTPQIDLLRAAQADGRRTGICVFSWDHLSSKALLRVKADRVFVWNETQRQEAISWHGVAPERIVVTGAQCYDHWFGRRPSRERDEFCRGVGLDPARPFLLYACSVMTPDPHEVDFVLRWIHAVRASTDPRLRDVGLLIRPHPERMEEWEGVDVSRFGNVALFGRNPVSPEAKDDYFDSLFHSHAVVGLVTSAFVEAAVVGRKVYTVMLPEYRMYQEGVAHFHYLLEVEGGLLETSRSFEEHLARLAAAVTAPLARDARNVRFVQAFVRPQGIDVASTPGFVEAVEALRFLPQPEPVRYGAIAHSVQRGVEQLARSVEHGWARPLLRDTREMDHDASEADKSRSKEQVAAAKQAYFAAKKDRLKAHVEARERGRRAREHRKQIARLKGRLKALMGLAGR